MADVTTINGYNVKDSTARSGIASEEAARKSQVSAINRVLEKGFAKQIREIDAKASGILYLEDVDDDAEYEKDVQSKVLPLAAVDVVGGRTVVWNQICPDGQFQDSSLWKVYSSGATATFSDNAIHVSNATGRNGFRLNTAIDGKMILNHIYFFRFEYTSTVDIMVYTGNGSGVSPQTPLPAKSSYTEVALIQTCILTRSINFDTFPYFSGEVGDLSIRNLMLIDLTAMFGAGNEPSTVAEFRAMFPSDYYAYSANTLLNADVVNVKSVGKNLINPSSTSVTKSGITYELTGDGSVHVYGTASSAASFTIFGQAAYDENDTIDPGTYTLNANEYGTESTWYVRWYPYNEDGLSQQRVSVLAAPITFSYDKRFTPYLRVSVASGQTIDKTLRIQFEKGSTATTYSPYTTASLPIPSAARALCPLYGASAGSAYNYIDWDARVYHQLVGSRNYQSGDESDTSVVTDGTTTYYALATEVTVDLSSVLTADNFIEVEAEGTITLENSHGDTYRIPVPSTETYEIDVNL